uniref:Uncharacterized protein n=1 Tax=Romanomermis culicivorax TaxID=13658 RepID=A0A915KB90_ROMCU
MTWVNVKKLTITLTTFLTKSFTRWTSRATAELYIPDIDARYPIEYKLTDEAAFYGRFTYEWEEKVLAFFQSKTCL